MNNLRRILLVCGLMLTFSLAGHAQYLKMFLKDGFQIGYSTEMIDSVTTENISGDYYHGIYFHYLLEDGSPYVLGSIYKITEIDSLRFIDPMHGILAELKNRGNFTYFLRLVGDIDKAESRYTAYGNYTFADGLAGLEDYTVFVAPDAAWESFFANNAKLAARDSWHNATSYDKLSLAQKKLLFKSSISPKSVSKEIPENLRSYNDIEVTDSITFIASQDLPFSYNSYQYGGSEKDYWERFREENGGRGIYLALDSTPPMTIHLAKEYMAKNDITDYDFEKIMGMPRNYEDVHVYDALLTEGDFACDNGYINVTEKTLRPLTNMAEVIRTNGKTNIFSHILDRFSAPFYCNRITRFYQDYHPEFTDSVFIKRYFSDNNYSVKAGYVKPDANGVIPKFEPGPYYFYKEYNPYKSSYDSDIIPALKFDPGWNGYYDETDVRKDMAAMFVPTDDAMRYFFTRGPGQRLLRVYYANEGTPNEIEWVPPTWGDDEALFRQIDCIPVGTIYALVNNMMQRSFVKSVPSKWGKLTDDAMEPLIEDVDVAREWYLDTCLLANNGVVYVMDRIFIPADFYSVTAPAFISKLSRIIKSALYGDYMNLNYSAYLKNMKKRFSFFLPTDDALKYYYDAASMKSRTPRAIKFSFQGGSFPVKLQLYNYYCPYNKDKGELGTIGNLIPGMSTYTNSEVTNRLKDILESHTIEHDGTSPMTHSAWGSYSLPTQEYYGISTMNPLPEYYISKNGCPIKVIRDEEENVIAVKGGFQLENERQGITSATAGVTICNITEPNETNNGYTFVLDAPLVPTYRSVYSIFTNDANMGVEGAGGDTPYSAFYDLCMADAYNTEIIGCGLVEGSLLKTQREEALKKFRIFVSDNGLDFNVQFFNNYRYTVFVPTNEAVEAAIADGLPTWEEIYEDYHNHCKPDIDWGGTGLPKLDSDGDIEYTDTLQTYEDSVRIAAKITYLTNFVRYHFADNSVFADKPELASTEMVTSSYDSGLEQFCKIHVDRVVNGDGTDLRVCDDVTWKENGNSMVGMKQPLVTVGEKNVLARDISCSSSPVNIAMKGITINSSSAAVIHSINGYLNHTEVIDGRHDKMWESTIKAKEYLQRYAIH